MVQNYLDGDLGEIGLRLNFPYEIENQYQKMCREEPDYAGLICDYLVENGTNLCGAITTEAFHAHIQKQYVNVMDGVY